MGSSPALLFILILNTFFIKFELLEQKLNYKQETMILFYKDFKYVKTTCEIKKLDGKIVIDFWSDCGKFGTNEMIDGYVLTTERLLQILQEREDITDDEL